MSGDVHDIDTESNAFDIVVDKWGDARGVRNQFARSNPGAIDPLINGNIAAYHLATDTLTPGLANVRSALQECWQGDSADHALTILDSLQTDSSSIGTNTLACHDSLVTFQQQWRSCKTQASHLYEGIMGSGVHEDNSGARAVYAKFTGAMQTAMHSMPSTLTYTTPLSGNAGSVTGPGPGPGGHGFGPGVGGYGPGPGPGPIGAGTHIGKVRTLEPHVNPVYTSGNGGVGSGGGTSLAGYPVTPTPGAGPLPGTILPATPIATPPVTGIGGLGGAAFEAAGMSAALDGDAGLRAGTGLAEEETTGLESEAGLESELGVGSEAGLGADAELESQVELERGELGAGADDGVGGGAAEEENEGLGGRGGGRPGGDDESERTRVTWLDEDEGIWDGDSGAPPGVIG